MPDIGKELEPMIRGGYTKGKFTAKRTGGSRKSPVYTVFDMDARKAVVELPCHDWETVKTVVDQLDKAQPAEYPARHADPPKRADLDLPPIRSRHLKGDPF